MLQPPSDCNNCERLVGSRKAVVYGAGPLPADVLVVAQAPGAKEERATPPQPLIGWSGNKLQYLTVEVAGLDWSKIRRTNVALCRPPSVKGGDLPPTPQEIRNCAPYLLSEITAASPRLIITLGAPAAKWFFPKSTFASIRGKVERWTHPDTEVTYDVCPMYHPAAAAPGRNAGLYKTMEVEWAGLTKLQRPGTYWQISGKEAAILFHQNFQRPFAFDLETKNNHWPPLGETEWNGFPLKPKKDHTFQAVRAEIIGWSFCFEEGTAYYCTDDVEWVRAALEDTEWETIVHNGLFEYSVLDSIDIKLGGMADTKIMAFLLGKPSSHLKDLVATEFGIRQTQFKEVNWDNLKEVVQYGAADSDYTFRLWNIFTVGILEAGGRLATVYNDIDLAVTQALTESQRAGFRIDQDGVGRVRDYVRAIRDVTQAELLGWYSGESINFGSNQQVGEWLYGDTDSGYWKITQQLKTRTHVKFIPPGLGLVCPKTTDSGQPAVDINTLHSLEHPVADLLIKLVSADKFLSGHARTFGFLAQEDGRVHPSYHLSGHWEVDDEDKSLAPGTGRLSSSGPNAQQITNYGDDSRPYVFEWGQELRRCIIPAPGNVFLEADFAQQEPRIAAMVSEDDYMNHLLQTADVYKPAAMALYKCDMEAVTKDMRQIGKRCWMAWLNRSGHAGIRRAAWWLTKEEAEEWIYTQDVAYETFTTWCNEQFDFLVRHEYVETWYGRRIYLPQVASHHPSDQSAAYRACIPGVIQGTGADVFKMCLLGASPFIKSLGGCTPLLVHDAIVAEVPLDRVTEAITYLKAMSQDMMPSPLPIEVLQGMSWSKLDMVEV